MWARINQTRHLYAWKPIFSIFILSKESCVVIELIRDRWNRWNIVLNTIYINLLSRMEEARLNRKVRNNFRELEYKSYQKKEKKILSKRWYLNSILSFLFFLIFESNRRIRTKEYNFFRLKPRFYQTSSNSQFQMIISNSIRKQNLKWKKFYSSFSILFL